MSENMNGTGGNVISFEESKVRAHDHLVRGTAADGHIRAIAVNAHDTVQEMHERHSTSPLVTAALGRLMMGGQMMGAMFKNPGELITLEVDGDGPIGKLTVTANSQGQVKGFAAHPNVWLPLKPNDHLDVGAGVGAGTLTVVRDQLRFEPYSSEVELLSGEIGDDLTYYFQQSDQVPTSVGVGVLVDRDTSVKQAGGFIVQLMPGYDDALVDALEANLKGIDSVTEMLEAGMAPSDMLGRVLQGLGYEELEAMPAEFYCGCNEERAERVTLALGAAELQDMIDHDEPAEIYCHFCGERYHFGREKLQELLDRASA